MIFDRRVVALVPMKAHSERVPDKNIRSFAGRPLFHHILDTLENTYAVDEVVVDTDSRRISTEAAKLFSKVRVIPRPKALCGDLVSMNDIISHDIQQVRSDMYVQTHATSPLLRHQTVSDAVSTFAKADDNDSLFTVTRLQARLYHADGTPINHDPAKLLRTQDLPPVYEENSCLYVFTAESFAAAGNRRIGLKPILHEVDRIEAIDIDDEFTFGLAEILARYAHTMRKDS